MKTIACWNDLRDHGISILTGEACGLTYRFLCDVTERGKKLLEQCLDVRIDLAEPWNCGAIGSVMLPSEMLVPLGVFALLEAGCREVWLKDGVLLGVEETDDEQALKRAKRGAARRFAYDGTAGSRNRHEFTGRVR